MQTDNRFMDDIARLATGALGALKGARGEVDTLVKARMERLAAQLDLVPREEFEAVRAMAIQARDENEALAARIAALEAHLGLAPAAAESTPEIVPQAPQPPADGDSAEAGPTTTEGAPQP